MIGGAICISTTSAFGVVGGYVIIVLVLLVSLIIITQRSFFEFFYQLIDSFLGFVKGRHEEYMEGQPERELKKRTQGKTEAKA